MCQALRCHLFIQQHLFSACWMPCPTLGAEEREAGLWPSGNPQSGGSGQRVPQQLQLREQL